jgi:hypothetical protein
MTTDARTQNTARRSRPDRPGTGPLRRWAAYWARRRADREWAHAWAAAVTPAQRDELLVLRSVAEFGSDGRTAIR